MFVYPSYSFTSLLSRSFLIVTVFISVVLKQSFLPLPDSSSFAAYGTINSLRGGAGVGGEFHSRSTLYTACKIYPAFPEPRCLPARGCVGSTALSSALATVVFGPFWRSFTFNARLLRTPWLTSSTAPPGWPGPKTLGGSTAQIRQGFVCRAGKTKWPGTDIWPLEKRYLMRTACHERNSFF